MDGSGEEEAWGRGRMARGGCELHKVSPRLAMRAGGRGTPETVSQPLRFLQPFQGWPACRAGSWQPSSTPFGHPMLYAYGEAEDTAVGPKILIL
jgi:hypothetical protein